MAGRYSRRRPRGTPAVVVAAEPCAEIATKDDVVVDPAGIRPALASAAAASLGELQQALLHAALGATRPHWISHQCTQCGQKQRVEVLVPDVRARVSAIELLLREGLGRPAQAEEPPSVPRLPATTAEAEALSWDALRRLAALHHLTDRDDLRERLRALTESERNVLRAALDEASIPA